MTDALAEWFLLRWEVDEKPWQELEEFLHPLVDDGSFADWSASCAAKGSCATMT